ncbi:hypothetical protein KR038_011922, partial [Drosophila bunnanda]
SASLQFLQSHLEMFIENVRQIEIMVSDVQPQTQTVLNQKLNGMIAGLREINKIRSQVEDVYVPLEVCYEFIDKNKNPHLYTRDVLLTTRAKNEEVKGTIEAFQKLKANLLLELFQTFPDEMNTYRAYRSDTM